MSKTCAKREDGEQTKSERCKWWDTFRIFT